MFKLFCILTVFLFHLTGQANNSIKCEGALTQQLPASKLGSRVIDDYIPTKDKSKTSQHYNIDDGIYDNDYQIGDFDSTYNYTDVISEIPLGD